MVDKNYAIFDMDGTLVDSMKIWENLPSQFLKEKGKENIPKNLAEIISHMPISESSEYLNREFNLNMREEEIIEELKVVMANNYEREIPLKNKVKPYLDQLKNRGVKMAVASVTSKDLIIKSLAKNNVLDYFDKVISVEELDTSKRSPKIYLACSEEFGANPQEVAVYEDSLEAITTAKKAGFYTVGVYEETYSHHWQEIKTICDHILNFD